MEKRLLKFRIFGWPSIGHSTTSRFRKILLMPCKHSNPGGTPGIGLEAKSGQFIQFTSSVSLRLVCIILRGTDGVKCWEAMKKFAAEGEGDGNGTPRPSWCTGS